MLEVWRDIMQIIQRYVTCEGRFATIYIYHMRFLQHVLGIKRLNLPYYFLKSLSKMATRVKNHPEASSHIIFHHGLVKLLITKELEKHKRSWPHFLFWSGFKVESRESDESKKKQTPVR